MSTHFDNKDALEHVIEKHAEGIVSLSESHGTEIPGHLSAGADALREGSVILFLGWLLLESTGVDVLPQFFLLAAFGLGWLAWRTGRSAWLGWSRLERLHRLIEQEKYEIEHHRPQERDELKALYRAKGFSGKLLEEVVDTLMANQDRLLKVMLEEELGLTLQAYEHPLKQATGAFIGGGICVLWLLGALLVLPFWGLPLSALGLLIVGAILSAAYEKNKILSALVWNVSLALLAGGVTFFLLEQF